MEGFNFLTNVVQETRCWISGIFVANVRPKVESQGLRSTIYIMLTMQRSTFLHRVFPQNKGLLQEGMHIGAGHEDRPLAGEEE